MSKARNVTYNVIIIVRGNGFEHLNLINVYALLLPR